jgi:hypothetical protein
MVGLIVLFVGLCIRNEHKYQKVKAELGLDSVSSKNDVESEKLVSVIEQYQYKIEDYKKTIEEGEMAFLFHNEMNDAVKFTQDLINQGL